MLKLRPIYSRLTALLWPLFLLFTPSTAEAICKKEEKPKIFIISTEFQIGKIKHMVEKTPEGVYISVGSERSFRGASMAPLITRVYLLDTSPEICRFNQINSQLLKAPNRQAYLLLRWEAPYEDWKKLNLSLKEEDFDWWQKNVRDLSKMDYALPEALNKHQAYPDALMFQQMRGKLISFYRKWKAKEVPTLSRNVFLETVTFDQIKDIAKRLNIPQTTTESDWEWRTSLGKTRDVHCPKLWLDNPEQAVDLGKVVDYKTGNYLFDDVLYDRLHQLALKGQFISLKMDLSDNAQLEDFLVRLKKEKDVISVLDLDNLYYKNYIGQNKYKEIVQKFLGLGQDTSLLIVMTNSKDYACGQFQTYVGFTFENIRHWPPFFYLQSFFDTLPKELTDLIQGRVYEKEETPPYEFLLGD